MKKLHIFTLIALAVIVIGGIVFQFAGILKASAPNPGHSAAEIGAGTFGADVQVADGTITPAKLTTTTKVKAWLSGGGLSIPDTTYTSIPFANEVYDTKGEFDTSSHLFTAQESGYYLVIASVWWAGNSNGQRTLEILDHNSVIRAKSYFYPAPTSGSFVQMTSAIIYLGAGGSPTVRVYQSSGGALNIGNNSDATTFLCVARIL